MIKKLLFACFLLGAVGAVSAQQESASNNYADAYEDNSSFENQVSLYPNPASEKLVVSNDSSTEITVTIYNVIGDPVVEKIVTKIDAYFDLSDLPSGVYIVAFSNGSEVVTERLLKN